MLPAAGVVRHCPGPLHFYSRYIGADQILCYLRQVSYVVVLVPYIAILVLLVRGVSMSGSSDGIRFYTTPRWELLRQPRMWGDAAAQVFFSLSVCWGGLTTLASYNKFHNNIYR